MNSIALYKTYISCNGVVNTDSRDKIENSLFFALKGDKFDGNLYAKAALENGAFYAVIDNPELAKEDHRFILVDDTLQTLQNLARIHRETLNTPIIAITGTNGKTTTKELITAVLKEKYNIHYTKGNFNNHIGVPLTLLAMRKAHQLAVIEMGANHPGEIALLTSIVKPNFGLITNVGKAHLEGFGSFEGVIKTKKELYDYIKSHPTATLFINQDDANLMTMAKGIQKRYSYSSASDKADILGSIIDNKINLSLSWKSKKSTTLHKIQSQLIGDYNLYNMLAAITIGSYFEVEEEAIDKALTAYQPVNNRSQLKESETNQLIIDAYNANPTSMAAAIKNFDKLESSQTKMAILGDMRELGEDAVLEHQHIIDLLTQCKNIQHTLLIGEIFGKTNHNYTHFNTTDEFKRVIEKEPIDHHTILIKGSNGLKLFTLIDLL